MKISRVAERLGLPKERLSELQETIVKESDWPHPKLIRFDKPVSGVEAGTVVFYTGEVVYGYPKIRRAMLLEPAIKRQFAGIVAVEEKMNGYNLRATSIDGEIVALTRGGYICPFSTEVVQNRIDPEVFRDHPGIVLCGEMVGPENPYVPKSVYPVDSAEFVLFDIAKKNSRVTQGVHPTHDLAEEYGLNVAPLLGEFRAEGAYKEIVPIVRDLGKRGREGIVIKDVSNEAPPIKYTCSESNCMDLEYAFRYYNDYASDFIVSRVVREGFQAVEWGESSEEIRARAARLGESILLPLADTIERKMEKEQIVQSVQIRVKSIQTARDFEQHLRRMGTRAIFDVPMPDVDGFVVRIDKMVMSTNDKTQAMIDGQLW